MPEKKIEQTPEDIIQRSDRKKVPVQVYDNQWNPKRHEIMVNKLKYPDRQVVSEYINEAGEKKKEIKTIPLIRIALPYQKSITKIAAAFFCGIPIKYANKSDENTEMYDSLQKLIDKAKTRFIDTKVYTATARYTECAEMWYWTDGMNDHYGFRSMFEIGVQVLTPDKYNLYPEFDTRGKMVRFSREWKVGDKYVFESYTTEKIEKWERENEASEYVQISSEDNPIQKIPFVYYEQEEVEWADVQSMIERLEEIYSNIGESNDRFAFPILKLKGTVTGAITQDRSGRVLQMEGEGSDAEFASQTNAAESLMLEIKNLERSIYDLTNTPNLSPEALKGLGNLLSGVAMRYFFMAAHLKVMEKQEIYEPALLRRVSVISSILQELNPRFRGEKLDIEPIITPYTIDSDEDLARFLMDVSGGQPLYSQKRAMEEFGVTDPDAMVEEIEEERARRADYENAQMFF